ncbi:unnamed protein product [Calypogeia fissa]
MGGPLPITTSRRRRPWTNMPIFVKMWTATSLVEGVLDTIDKVYTPVYIITTAGKEGIPPTQVGFGDSEREEHHPCSGEFRHQNKVETRTNKERSQPSDGNRLGLLEKHKDYVLRAKDFHKKEKSIQRMGMAAREGKVIDHGSLGGEGD